MLWIPLQQVEADITTGSGAPGSEGVVVYLGFMRTRILEELAYLNGSTLLHALHRGGGGCYPAGVITKRYHQRRSYHASNAASQKSCSEQSACLNLVGSMYSSRYPPAYLADDTFTVRQVQCASNIALKADRWSDENCAAGDMSLLEDFIAAAAELAHRRCSCITAYVIKTLPKASQLSELQPQVLSPFQLDLQVRQYTFRLADAGHLDLLCAF